MSSTVEFNSEPKNPIAKSLLNPTSLRSAIDAHCYRCCGGSQDDLRAGFLIIKSIRECKSELCDLIRVRPYQHGQESVENMPLVHPLEGVKACN